MKASSKSDIKAISFPLSWLVHFPLLALVAAMLVADHCRAEVTNPPPSLEVQLRGEWLWFPDELDTNILMKVHLSPDKTWKWSLEPTSTSGRTDEQSGSWFVHDRKLVVRVEKAEKGYIQKMAYVFDVRSITPESLVINKFCIR